MEFLGTLKPPVVAALPAAGDVGRMVRLSTDNHIYHDNGTSWDDLTEPVNRAAQLQIKTVLASRRTAFRAMLGKKQFLNTGGIFK